MRSVHQFWKDEDGATAIEYALICSLILLAILAAASQVGTNVTAMWNNIAAHI